MAFPAVQTADTKNGTVTSNSSSWTLTYPTNLASGDLIVALVAADGNPAPTWPADWVGSGLGGGAVQAVTLLLGWKISNGAETGNFTLTLDESEQGGWRVFRITGWFGSGFGTTGVDGDGTSFDFTLSGSSSTPDPPAHNPANWDVEDTLWIAVCAVDTSRTVSVWPLADLQTADVSGGAGGATLGICMANDAVASKDPGTFTISASDDWNAATIAIRPAAAAAAGPTLEDDFAPLQILVIDDVA